MFRSGTLRYALRYCQHSTVGATTNKITSDWRHREMVALPWPHRFHRPISSPRVHACAEAYQEGTDAAGIPPGMLQFSLFEYPRLTLTSKFLVTRRQRAMLDPNYQYPQPETRPYFHNQQYFGMQNMPPPVYDPAAARPPMYSGPQGPAGPPDGATKVDPTQQNAPQYEAPPGPPPSTIPPQNTGSNPFRL